MPEMPLPGNVVDAAAHTERFTLDWLIAEMTEQLRASASTTNMIDHHQGLLKLQDLTAQRKDAYRREVGWTG